MRATASWAGEEAECPPPDVTGCQAILVSHHPEIINQMANESECWFTRNTAGHVEVKPFPVSGTKDAKVGKACDGGIMKYSDLVSRQG